MKGTIYGMIDDLYLYCIVVEKKSIAAASLQLNVPTSTISRRLTILESKLDAKLLTKKGRSVVPTEFGLSLFQSYQSIFNHLNNDLFSKKSFHGEISGRVKLVVPSVFYQGVLRSPISQFLIKYPDVELELVLSQDEVEPELDTDIVIMFRPPVNEEVIARPLFESPYAIYAGYAMIERIGIPSNFKELRNSKWILNAKETIKFLHNGKVIEELDDLNHIMVNNNEAAIGLVESGVGIASLPMHLVKDNNKMVRIFPEYEQPKYQAYLVYKERRYQTKATHLLIEMLLEEVEKFRLQ